MHSGPNKRRSVKKRVEDTQRIAGFETAFMFSNPSAASSKSLATNRRIAWPWLLEAYSAIARQRLA